MLVSPFNVPALNVINEFDSIFAFSNFADIKRTSLVGFDKLERRLAYLVAVNPDAYRLPMIDGAPIVRPHGEVSALTSVMQRIDSEPAVQRLQRIARCMPLSVQHLLGTAERLCGKPQAIREGNVRIRPDGDGQSVMFGPAAKVRIELRRLLRFIEAPCSASGFAQAFVAMAMLLSIHPLDDGNGRLARAVMQAVLAKRGILHGPVLPLGPVIKLNDYVHAGAFRAVALHGDWEKLLHFYAAASERTARAVAGLTGGGGHAGGRARGEPL